MAGIEYPGFHRDYDDDRSRAHAADCIDVADRALHIGPADPCVVYNQAPEKKDLDLTPFISADILSGRYTYKLPGSSRTPFYRDVYRAILFHYGFHRPDCDYVFLFQAS